MKNSMLFLLLTMSLAGTIFSQNAECKKWKNGSFYMLTPENDKIEIVRKGNQQVEYNTKTQEKTYLKVKWVKPCTYELRHDVKKNGKDEYPGLVITVSIIEFHENYIMIDITANLFNLQLQQPFYRNAE